MDIDDSGLSRNEEARNDIFPPAHFFPNLKTPPSPPVQIPAAITDPRGPPWSRTDPLEDPGRSPGQAQDGPVTNPCCLTGPPPCRVFAHNSSNASVGRRRSGQSARLPVASIAPPL
jgi:hypothetical protein